MHYLCSKEMIYYRNKIEKTSIFEGLYKLRKGGIQQVKGASAEYVSKFYGFFYLFIFFFFLYSKSSLFAGYIFRKYAPNTETVNMEW